MKKNRFKRRIVMPMTEEEAQRQLTELAERHAADFRENGTLPAVVFFILRAGEPSTMIALEESSRADRARMWRQLEVVQEREDCVIGTIGLSWCTTLSDRETPDKKEALAMVAQSRHGKCAWTAEITRHDDGTSVLHEWDKMESTTLCAYPDDDQMREAMTRDGSG